MRSIPRRELCAALALTALVSACRDPYPTPRFMGAGATAERRGGVLRVAFDTDLRTLDPAQAYDELSTAVTHHLNDTLIDYDEHGAIVPQLAERYELSPDQRTYTFVLRPNLTFSDGSPLDSRAFVRSFERMLNPSKVPCPGTSFYHLIDGADDFGEGRAEHIRGVSTPDARTIVIRLTEPDQTFLNAMAMGFTAPVPVDYVNRVGNDEFARNPIGSGPFVLERWEMGSRVVLRRNPRYWNPQRPLLDGVVYELSLARHLQFMRFQRADLDHANDYALTTADYISLNSQPAWRPYIERSAEIAMYGVAINCELPPFDNAHVRRAISFAIDRDAIARSRNYRIRPLGGLYPPGLPGYDPNLPGAHGYDVERARRELREGGYPNGLPGEHELWLTEGPGAAVYGQLFQADLARIGITIRLKFASFPVFLEMTQRRRAVAMSFTGWNMDFPDPSNFIDTLFHSRNATEEHAQNQAFYRNPELDALLDRARVEPDRARRLSMYQQAERIVVRDAPWAFMFAPQKIEVDQPYVHRGAHSPVYPHDMRNAWMDLPIRPWVAGGAR